MNSKRSYVVLAVCLGTGANFCKEISLDEIVNPTPNDWEYKYALNEIIDDVLDLQILDVLPFKASRDSNDKKGVIIRKS